MAKVVINSIPKWLEENEKYFLPPICNKMMHNDGQMKAFFVGGPNVRNDYHIEEGEELFYMRKGDMCLKIVEQGKHKDVPIKEGEIFLLPCCIPHSPQRQENTIGLVLERERAENEMDGLRYFIQGKTDILFERWFLCTDLGSQLGPIIKEFFASEQFKTNKPIKEDILENPPLKIDIQRTVEDPFLLKDWIEKNKDEINSKGMKKMFGDNYQFSVAMHGKGEEEGGCEHAETWMWQLEGKSELTVGDVKFSKHTLEKDHSLLVPQGINYVAKRGEGSLCLVCFQDPTKKQSLKKN